MFREKSGWRFAEFARKCIHFQDENVALFISRIYVPKVETIFWPLLQILLLQKINYTNCV